MNDFWTIRATAYAAEILLYDSIGDDPWGESTSAKDFLTALSKVHAKNISLRINSPGGSVIDGMAIYNAIQRHPAKVTAHVDGLAASIASVIALAADEVHMSSNALWMIHNPAGLVMGDAHDMRGMADLLDKIADQMADIYASRSSLTVNQIIEAMNAETWYSATEAESAGFVDHITNPIPVAAHFDLSIFKNPPRKVTAMSETETESQVTTTAIPAPVADSTTYTAVGDTTRLDITPRATGAPSLTDWVMASARQDGPALAAMRHRLQAVAPHTLSTDIPGLIPEPIVTPVVSLRDAQAPLFNALGPNAAPAGDSFRIPKITTHIADAAVAAEKSDVTAPLVVGEVDVTMHFIKRAANISYEAIQYSNPGVVGIAASDLVDAVLRGAEKVTTTGIEAATGTNAPINVTDDGSDAWAVLSAGVSAFYSASGQMPSHFATAPDVWAALAGLTNALGQPLITGVAQNLAGSWGSLFGVPVIVSPMLTAGKGFLLSDYGVKTWASSPVNLQVSQATTFAYELGGGRNVGVSIADPKFITPVAVVPVETPPLAKVEK